MKKEKIIEAPLNSYLGVFLNLSCNLPCEYCVQKISRSAQPPAKYPLVSGKKWVEALNALSDRLQKRFLLPSKKKKIAIMGGESTLHPDLVYILNNLDDDWRITVTSNLTSSFFDNDVRFLRQIKRRKNLKFNASFHFMYSSMEKFIENVGKLKKAGHFIHILFIVAHPAHMDKIKDYQKKLLKIHPTVKLQRFLGSYNGKLYPFEDAYDFVCEQKDGIKNYAAYCEGFGQKEKKDIYCRMNKVLLSPNGDIYNCHYKLYSNHKDKFGNIFEENIHAVMPQGFFLCHDYGFCNPCDSEGHSFKRLNGKEFSTGSEET